MVSGGARPHVGQWDTKAPIIPVFYHVDPGWLRRANVEGSFYAKALRKMEEKETDEGKPRYDPATIQKWREALCSVSDTSGIDLQKHCNGDEGELVKEIVKHVLEKVKNKSVVISEFHCSQEYGCPGD